MAGAVRDYQFIVGPETSVLPTPGTPVDPGDVVTLDYADDTYAKLVEWGHAVQTVAALKAVAAADRADKQVVFLDDLRSLFQFDSGSSATGDDVTVITPTAGTGRWIRIALDSFTASRALVSDANGHVVASTALATEVAQLTGATSQVVTEDDARTISALTFAQVLTPDANGTRDIGSSGTRWRDLWLSRDLVVEGDLTINGTTTTVNTANLEVEDKNINLNNGGNDASAEGAGLNVERTSTHGSLVFDSTLASKWKLGLAGAEIQVADVSSVQTFTNKTLAFGSNTFTGQLTIANGGTGQSTANTAFNALSPMTTNYDLITRIAGVADRVAKGGANQVLIMDGTGTTFGWGNAPAVATNANDSSGSVTVSTGNSFFNPYLNILAPHTYTVSTGAQLVTVDQLTVAGTLITAGTAIVKILS